MKNKVCNNKGFTLIELIVALAIMSLLMIAVIGLMSMNSTTGKKVKADTVVQNNAQELYDDMESCIMQAKAVTIISSDASPRVYDDTDDFNTLSPSTEIEFSKISIVYPVNFNKDYSSTVTKVDGGKDLCTVTYEYVPPASGETGGKIYVYRKYDNMDRLNTYNSLSDDTLYASDVTSAKVKVDSANNAMEVMLSYDKNNRTYDSDCYVKVRNSYVLKKKN